MDAREASRLQLARRVVRLMADPTFRQGLARTSAGDRPVVVSLPDDTVSYMFEMARAAGPVANVITVVNEGFAVLGMTADVHEVAPMSADEHDCPVHPDTHVDMLVTYLRRRAKPVRCFVVAPDYEFGLVREMAHAPA